MACPSGRINGKYHVYVDLLSDCTDWVEPVRSTFLLNPPTLMEFPTQALAELRQAAPHLPAKRAVVGLDGFVDTIVTPVALRNGQGEDFEPINTITEFGERVLQAAGKSANIEFFPRMDKLGGNGPIMANALMAHGVAMTYVGALGQSAIHPVFQDFAQQAKVISITDPATTTAVEFTDGKLMLGQMRCLDDVTYDALETKLGAAGVDELLGSADLISLVNWTMIPNMTEIFRRLVSDALPRLPAKERFFFFDLADPQKRSREDLLEVLAVIGEFGQFGQVTLGLNLKEAQQVHLALDFHTLGESKEDLQKIAADIRERLNYATVVVHPKESAACATADGTSWIPGPYVTKPVITTGAGDHFNAGFSLGQMLGLSATSCLALGCTTSGHYVRTAQSPTFEDLETFLANWPK